MGEPAFVAQQAHFTRVHCYSFYLEGDENKLEHTQLHDDYVAMVDSELTTALTAEMGSGFDMAEFLAALPAFVAAGGAEGTFDDGEAAGPQQTLDVLTRLTSFISFKEDMRAAKRAKQAAAEVMAANQALYFSVAQPRR